MNITLIYPLLSRLRSTVDENKQYWPPLGLAYLAAVLLARGHKVQIIDRDVVLRKEKLDFNKVNEVTLQRIRDFNSQIVGFSATTPNISDVDCFSKILKRSDKRVLTVLGGPHVTGEPDLTLQTCKDIDVAVRGEGEEAIVDLADEKSFGDIAGITYRLPLSDKIFNTAQRALIPDIDVIPMPARELLDMDFYCRPSRFTSRNLSLRTTHIFTARGCPYCCHYCAGPLMGRGKVRYHSPERVLKEVNQLAQTYKIEAVYFAEDMFLSNKKRAEKLLSLFIESGLNKRIVWMAQLSTNIAQGWLLSLMKKSGCIHVEYGFESGSQRILDLMNKRSTVKQNYEAAKLTRGLKLRFQGNFILGYPGETEKDFMETIDFIKKVKPDQISANMFMPLPGTHIYQKLKNEKKLLSGWDDIGNQDAAQLNYADMPVGRFERLYLESRLKVILPMNLKSFILSNALHPGRLVYIICTQSYGLTVKIIRSFFKLIRPGGLN